MLFESPSRNEITGGYVGTTKLRTGGVSSSRLAAPTTYLSRSFERQNPDCLLSRSPEYSGALLDIICVERSESAARAAENVLSQVTRRNGQSLLVRSFVFVYRTGGILPSLGYVFATNTNGGSFERSVI